MLNEYGKLLKRDAWKLLAFLIGLFLLQLLIPFSSWIVNQLGVINQAETGAKAIGGLLLLEITVVKAVSLAALAGLAYWACGTKWAAPNRSPFISWTALVIAYAVIDTFLAILPTLLLVYGEMSLHETAMKTSVYFTVWTLCRYGLFLAFFMVICSVLGKTPLRQPILILKQHWGKLIITAVFLVLISLLGGLSKWLQYPLFIGFAAGWILLIYGFAAYQIATDTPR